MTTEARRADRGLALACAAAFCACSRSPKRAAANAAAVVVGSAVREALPSDRFVRDARCGGLATGASITSTCSDCGNASMVPTIDVNGPVVGGMAASHAVNGADAAAESALTVAAVAAIAAAAVVAVPAVAAAAALSPDASGSEALDRIDGVGAIGAVGAARTVTETSVEARG